MRINKRENDAVMNASVTSEGIRKGPLQDQWKKVIKTKPAVPAQDILSPHCLLLKYTLGILQGVLDFGEVGAVY